MSFWEKKETKERTKKLEINEVRVRGNAVDHDLYQIDTVDHDLCKINEGSVSDVHGMTHLLHQSFDRGDIVDDQHEINEGSVSNVNRWMDLLLQSCDRCNIVDDQHEINEGSVYDVHGILQLLRQRFDLGDIVEDNINEGFVSDVRGMTHLLRQSCDRGDTVDDLHEIIKDVYLNFTSIHEAILEHIRRKFTGSDIPSIYRLFMKDMGIVITFCRWQLNCMVKDDGLMNKSSVPLLEKIEGNFLLICAIHDHLYRGQCTLKLIIVLRDAYITPLADEIKAVYRAAISRNETSLMPNYLLIGNKFILEFLNQIHEDLHVGSSLFEEKKTMRGYLDLLGNYFVFTADRINSDVMKDFLISSQVVASKMAYYIFFSNYTAWAGEFESIRHGIESDIHLGCLRAALVLQQHVPSCIPAMKSELLTIYVNCIHNTLSDLLRPKAFVVLTSPMTDPFAIPPMDASMTLLADSRPPTTADDEKLSNIRVLFHSLVRIVRLLSISCFNDKMKRSIRYVLSNSIRKVDHMTEEIIEDMYSFVLGTPGNESLITHRQHILIILLENLEDLIRSNYELTKTWKDQFDAVYINLVLFKSFILNIEGNSTTHEELKNNEESDYSDKDEQIKALADEIWSLRNHFQLDTDQTVCHHLFRRYGEVHWWKVYFKTKDHVVSQIRVGVLRAAVLLLEASSTQPLSDELLMGYVDCIQDTMTELVTDEPGDQMKIQIERLRQDLSFPVLLFIKNYAGQEKQSEIKLRFQVLLRNIGSVICSCFNNRLTNLVREQSIEVPDLLEKMNILQEETQGFQYTVILHRIRHESPKVHLPGFFDLLLHNWNDFMGCESDTVRYKKDQCQMIHETLVLFRSFIQSFTTNPTRDEESRKLWNDIIEAGYVAEYLLDSFADETFPVSCTSHWISEFTEHIKLIEACVMEFNRKNANDKIPALNNVVVGLKVEMSIIKRILYSRQQHWLDVVSIVGMPGSGKTTLARKFYDDPSAEKHFDVRVWCVISQEYNKKELFLTILGAKFEVTELIGRNSETELSVMVHKMLKGRRYFIVLDDVWAIDAFTGLKNFFPDDNIGSRIMLTSRSKVIASQVKYHSDPVEIGLLNDEESWDLLERKIYPQGKCPSELCELGKKIAQKCKGLPLAVVVVAGFLAKSVEKHELWEEVAENLSSSYLDHDSKTQWMGPLELSYKFLPDHLKPLFLYLGAFPEDEEIPMDKLMWLWIADGFVQDTGLRSLEMEAEMSMMDLIDRNLVMVSKRSSDGRVKTCHIHDLLHDMCLAKAREVKFMEQIHDYKEFSESVMFQRRVSVFLKRDTPTSSKPLIQYKYFRGVPVSPLRALLLFDTTDKKIDSQDHIPDFSSLKLSRAIHSASSKINIEDMIKLLHLRYISVRTDCNNIPESLSNLKNLETLIIDSIGGEIVLPCSVWEMLKLRHLHVNDHASFSDAPENSPKLVSLITLSTPTIDSGKVKNFFQKVPNVQKLGCIFNKENSNSNKEINECYDLESLHKLQSLKASYSGSVQSPREFNLPKSLRKLSLSKFSLKWSQVSIFQNLPNLEVLKLRSAAVEDEFWDMGDDEFPKLKVLKLDNLNIKTWGASEDNFPCLEKLVLERCKQLEEIPFSLGGICSLEKIDVIWCSHSAAISAKEIEDEQTKAGNSSLNVYIYPPQLAYDQSSSETLGE